MKRKKIIKNIVGVYSNNLNKGITLVALVITIIILLILAGITISQLTGSGLFENAKLAEEKSKNAQEKEEKLLEQYANSIDKITFNNRELLDNGEIRFYNGMQGFQSTSGEVNIDSYGLTYKTFPTEPGDDNWLHSTCEKVQNINLNSKFEMSAQIYFNNKITADMGMINIKLMNNDETICQFTVNDSWVGYNDIIISSSIKDSQIYNAKYTSMINGSGRYAIICDGEKAYFYWGKELLGSIDYTEGITANKIVIDFIGTETYNEPVIYIENIYVGEPLYYKYLMQ